MYGVVEIKASPAGVAAFSLFLGMKVTMPQECFSPHDHVTQLGLLLVHREPPLTGLGDLAQNQLLVPGPPTCDLRQDSPCSGLSAPIFSPSTEKADLGGRLHCNPLGSHLWPQMLVGNHHLGRDPGVPGTPSPSRGVRGGGLSASCTRTAGDKPGELLRGQERLAGFRDHGSGTCTSPR